MHHSVSLELYSYWIDVKGQRYAPSRSDIEPASIRTLLSDTFILQTDELENTEFRLAGTNICELFGQDLKGVDFLDIWGDYGRETLESSLRILRNDAAGIFATWKGRTRRYHETSGELLMLPLAYEGRIQRILGAFVALEKPYWQGTFPMKSADLTDIRVILPTEHGLPMRHEKRFAAMDSPANMQFQQGRKIAHLTIFDGGQN